MRKLPAPIEDASQVYRTCISGIRNEELRMRLEEIQPDIALAAQQFRAAGEGATFYNIPRSEDVRGVVTKDEMSGLYKYRMAKKKAPARTVYDRLLSIPSHGICPLCGQRTASTLDHYLPKTQYPALAVVPINLVPACKDCNKAKGVSFPLSENGQTLHPYFDDLDGVRWLYSEVIEGAPAVLRYHVQFKEALDVKTAARIRYHFDKFELAALYAAHAAEELVNINYGLARLFAHGGIEAVRSSLEERAASYMAANISSWQTAMYQALAGNNWFCSGGFSL